MIRIFLPLLAAALLLPAQTTRVLFVGNSYTYFNNMPEMLAKLVEAGHAGRLESKVVAPGGWMLKDHWERGSLNALHDAKWDYVLQNPVRAGLVARAEDWPLAGEIHELRW